MQLNMILKSFTITSNRIFRYIENKRVTILIEFAEINEDDTVLKWVAV
jgi:hypothetical protein